MNEITPDDILSEEDNRRLSEMITIKKHVYAFINKDELLRFILHLIDSSEIIRFERKHDRRFLSLMNLSMSLVLDVEKAIEKYGVPEIIEKPVANGRDVAMNARANLLRDLIVVPFTNLMNNMLGEIIDHAPAEGYEHSEWIAKILPENYRDLKNQINSFKEMTGAEKQQLKDEMKFMYAMASAFVFPPEEVSLNEDTGFTLEFLL